MSLLLISIFSAASYFTGVRATLQGRYKPNVYSRVIWFLLACNALAGVVRLGNDSGTVVLSILQTAGSLLILLASFKYSIFKFGMVEKVASLLLLVSAAIWLAGDYAVLNVSISLVAHFIGGIPTIRQVVKKASSENVLFWAYFGAASGVAVIAADKSNLQNYMFALYFLLYNTTMAILAARQHLPKRAGMQPIEM